MRTLVTTASARHVVEVVVTWALCTTGSLLDYTLSVDQCRHATQQCSAVVASRFQARDETSIPLFGSDTAGEDGDLLDDDDFLVNTIEGTDDDIQDVVDVAIVGAGLGGLCAGAIFNTVYGKTVAIFESHYIAGGCAHAFERTVNGVSYTLDSGPTILLGNSSPPNNALRQVLDAVNHSVPWIPYTGWGMIERSNSNNNTAATNEILQWRVPLGPQAFEQGPRLWFGGPMAVVWLAHEFQALQ
jgi:NAD(P)-binding Rossmann-like domain